MGLLNKIGFFVLLFILTLACSSEQEPKTTTVGLQEIRFNCFLQEGDQITPLGGSFLDGVSRTVPDNDLKGWEGFELYGVWNTKDMPTTFVKGNNTSTEAGIPFFNKQKIKWNASTGSFEYEGERRYWIADGKTRHSFAARSSDPFYDHGKYWLGDPGGGNTRSAFTTTRWVPSIDYYAQGDPGRQHDLLVAFGPMNVVVRNSTPTVNLYFKHALSKVRFKILSSAGSTLYGVKLDVTYIGGLRKRVATTFTAEEEEDLYYKPDIGFTSTLASGQVIPASASDERSAVTIGDMLVLPQTPTATWLELTISYSLSQTAPAKSAKIGLPVGVTLKAGMQYTYYIRVADQPSVLTITNLQLEPWTTVQKEVDPL